MDEQLNEKDWETLEKCFKDPKIKEYLQSKYAQDDSARPDQEALEDAEPDQDIEPTDSVPKKRTNGSSYRKTTTAGAYSVPIVGQEPKQRKQRVSATIKRKQEYLQACANRDVSVNKEVEINGKKCTRKKGYKEWYKEQYGPQFDGNKFTMKNTNIAPRKVFQGTIVKEAYKLVQNNPKLKGKDGNTLRLKIMSSAMKKFEDVYKDANFLTYIQDPKACSDLINDFAMELEEQITQKSV